MRVGIGLGSNLGDRLGFLRAAVLALRQLPGVRAPVLYSRVYESEPVGTRPGAPFFLNSAVEVEYQGDLHELLRGLQALEERLGRPPVRERNADRTIDLDLLYAEPRVEIETSELTLPHPRILERMFVMKPLADIQPDLMFDLPPPYTVAKWVDAAADSADAAGGRPYAEAPCLKPPGTLADLQSQKQRGEPISLLTAYDYPTARLLEEAGIDLLLVGDSLGMVVLGYPDTTSVTMADMLHHTRAVKRGVRQTPVVSDLPFGTYAAPAMAVENARLLVEAGADAVKLEGGQVQVPVLTAIAEAGIPVMAHLGMLPQSVLEEGGYRMKGKTPADADRLKADALAVQAAGAFAVVLELVQTTVAAEISALLRIPTIGIGAGNGCDGQVLVTHDLIGLFPWFTPKFAKGEARVGQSMRWATQRFIERTKARA